MIPTHRLHFLSGVWLIAGVAAVYWTWLAPFWAWLGVAALVFALADAVCLRLTPLPSVGRRLPTRFALGEASEVCLLLRHAGRRAAAMDVFDGIPADASAPTMPWSGVLLPDIETRVHHPVTINVRGIATFGPVWLRCLSPVGLWKRQTKHLSEEGVKVYPNYEPVVRLALLAMQHRENPLGIVRRSRPGSSRDFHQLRDYRDGDPFSQIDWKASSRRRVLISRDYQEQRNQSVVFMIDTGRRMRAMDGEMSQFDHVLNAVLLVAHVALKQGDQVSVKSFGGSDRWLPPVKGAHAMPVLLNHLYDYQSTIAPSDFSDGVEKLMTRQRRRSLVILLTNLRGEDGKELLPALQVLGSRHLVLLASMRERVVSDALTRPVETFPTALRHLAAGRYLQERREVLANLESQGILSLDVSADDLPVALANRYWEIKAAGRI